MKAWKHKKPTGKTTLKEIRCTVYCKNAAYICVFSMMMKNQNYIDPIVSGSYSSGAWKNKALQFIAGRKYRRNRQKGERDKTHPSKTGTQCLLPSLDI